MRHGTAGRTSFVSSFRHARSVVIPPGFSKRTPAFRPFHRRSGALACNGLRCPAIGIHQVVPVQYPAPCIGVPVSSRLGYTRPPAFRVFHRRICLYEGRNYGALHLRCILPREPGVRRHACVFLVCLIPSSFLTFAELFAVSIALWWWYGLAWRHRAWHAVVTH